MDSSADDALDEFWSVDPNAQLEMEIRGLQMSDSTVKAVNGTGNEVKYEQAKEDIEMN